MKILLGLAGLFVLAGCSTPYMAVSLEDEDPAHTRPFQQERDGLILAARLIEDRMESEALFFHDLPGQDVVPVVLHLENRGTGSAIFKLADVKLRLEDGTVLEPVPGPEIIDEFQRSLGAAYLGVPLIFPYYWAKREKAEFNFELTRDYRRKALPRYFRYAPGDPPLARALFFRLSGERQDALRRSPVLEVPVEVEARGVTGALNPGQSTPFILALE